MRITIALVTIVLAVPAAGPASAGDEKDLWAKLRGGEHVALLRHARAPGTGDPDDFSLRVCATQRNLSDEGREQAKRIGARMRANGVGDPRIYSSQWCRCLETARLLGLGPVEELPALNSFYQRFERREAQTRALSAWLASRAPEEPAVLVTHQVNISAIAEVYPAEGTLVIVRSLPNGSLEVAGTIPAE